MFNPNDVALDLAPNGHRAFRSLTALADVPRFHVLVELVDAARWEGDLDGAPADHNGRRQP